MGLADRLMTIVVTATLTSAAWIVAGSSLLDLEPEVQVATAAPAQAPPAVRGGLLVPVQGVRADTLADTYGQERAEGERLHHAIDIPAPRGTPVIAAAPSTVERVFQSSDGGNTLYLRSKDRRAIHYYAHLDQYAPGLHEGQEVQAGQVLGTVGSTGNAGDDSPHLHFAIMETTPQAQWWDAATTINPFPLLTGR